MNLTVEACSLSTEFAVPVATKPRPHFGGWVDSEYGVLEEVLLATPHHLRLVPCNAISVASLKNGQECCVGQAQEQHRVLVETLSAAGVEVRLVPSVEGLPDLTFTRDSSLMTPWGLLGLSLAAAHRQDEVDVVLEAAQASGVPSWEN